MKKAKNNRGFVLMLALLISSILLATGLGISRIILREIFLASLGRESSVAFFASDTGAECALHWYYARKFDLPALLPTSLPPFWTRSIFCNGQSIRDGADGPLKTSALPNVFQKNDLSGSLVSTFSFYTSNDYLTRIATGKPNPCALVTVTLSGGDPSDYLTYPLSQLAVNSRGYNNCDLTRPQTLERALEYALKID